MPSKDKIIIDVTESVNVTLDEENNAKKIEGAGSLKVINPSGFHRLWNLEIKNEKVQDKVTTNLPTDLKREGLNPNEEWETAYKMSDLNTEILKFMEIIDTSKNHEGTNSTFALNTADELSLRIKLKNVSEGTIKNIELKKEIPAYIKELKVVDCSSGTQYLDSVQKKLSWSVTSLEPGQSASIIVSGRTNVTDSGIKSSNPTDLTFLAEGCLYSAVKPSIKGLTDVMKGVANEEDDERPGWWVCAVELENESDFEVVVEKLKVMMAETTGEQTLLDIKPLVEVAPEKLWTHEFSIESPSVPSITHELAYTVNSEVEQRIIGAIHKEASMLDVIETRTTKDINPPSVNANANTDIMITITVPNLGSAKIDQVIAKDMVPKDFEPPDLAYVKCKIINQQDEMVASLFKDNAMISIDPNNMDPATSHEIKVECIGLNEWLVPSNKLVITYPIVARNPKPNVTYHCPLETRSWSKIKGLEYVDKNAEQSVIGIKYVKRKVRTAKMISPLGGDRYNVLIKLSNRGQVEFENITVEETIPGGYKVGEFSPAELQPELIENPSGNKLIWQIPVLDAGQVLKLGYASSEGSGEFPHLEPIVTINEGKGGPRPQKARIISHEPSAQAASGDSQRKVVGVISIFSKWTQELKEDVSCDDAATIFRQKRQELLEEGVSSLLLRDVENTASELERGRTKMLTGLELDRILKKISAWKSRIVN